MSAVFAKYTALLWTEALPAFTQLALAVRGHILESLSGSPQLPFFLSAQIFEPCHTAAQFGALIRGHLGQAPQALVHTLTHLDPA